MARRYGNYYNFKAPRSECGDRTRLGVIAFHGNIPQQYINIIESDISVIIFTQYILLLCISHFFSTHFLPFDSDRENRIISCNQNLNSNTISILFSIFVFISIEI